MTGSNNGQIADEDFESSGAGGHALAGYEYQIDVSIWLALDLVLAHKLTGELILEPVSQEDVEAQLAEHETGPVISKVALDGYRLLVQAKLRNGDAWTAKGLATLLAHGGKKRKSAVEHLADTNTRYLLVTSASLNGGARQFVVRKAGVWPTVTKIPLPIAHVLPNGSADRVAVIGTKTEELLTNDIQRLLTERFRVPNARWRLCWKALREHARARILGSGQGRWTRAEIEHVIRDHEGYLASSPELDRYVYPSQWRELAAAMSNRHAALIVGQSGTGKTMATRKLYEVLSEQIPGLARVHITHGPHQLTNDLTPPPVLYDVEDPWGRFDFDRNSRPWNDQLAGILARADAGRLIVATSRLDVATASGALMSVEPWIVRLEAEHYGAPERHDLFRTRIEALPRELQAIAMRAENIVLAKLATPLEIQKFFDALPTLDRSGSKYERKFVETAIQHAHQESIERTVIEQIGQREDVPAAAVMWALLKANGKLSLRGIRAIEDELSDVNEKLADSITPLIDFFIAARNLRQSEDVVTYYHPRVESGVEKSLLPHAVVVRRVLRQLVNVLTVAKDSWGAGVAARVIHGASLLEKLRPIPSPTAQAEVDTWLETNVPESGRELEAHLQLAAAAGSAASVTAELARYLLPRREENSRWAGLAFWRAPERDKEWLAHIRTNALTQPLLDKFVRQLLPLSDVHYPADFARYLQPLAPGLTNSFLAAARQIVGYGVVSSDDAIAGGALENLEAFELIVDAAVEVLTPTGEEREKAKEQRLAIVNGEYSEDYVEYLANDDEGYTASEFLKAYTKRVRGAGDWTRLAQHRHREHLLLHWLLSLEDEVADTVLDSDELNAVFASLQDRGSEERFWGLLQKQWKPAYLTSLLGRVRVGNPDTAVRQAALTCLITNVPAELPTLIRSVLAGPDQQRSVVIAIDLGTLFKRGARHDREDERYKQEINSAIATLQSPLDQIARASFALSQDRIPALDDNALALLAGATNGDTSLRRFRVDIDRHFPLPVEGDIRWLLAHSEDDEDAVAAVDAAIRHGLTREVRAALDHRFAHASARALTALAMPLAPPLPTEILEKAEARGSPVRKMLVAALNAKPHPDHLPTLLKLVRDKWSQRETYYGENLDYPIAQAAAEAIANLGALESDVAAQLHDIALSTNDRALRTTLFNLNAELADFTARERLVELATTPGRAEIQQAAASALLQSNKPLHEVSAARITPELLASCAAPVAATLALLLSLYGEPSIVLNVARELAPKTSRRALLLLLAWPMKDRDDDVAIQITALLPGGHAGVAKVLGMQPDELDASALDDLGDALVTAEVLSYIGKKWE